MADVRVRFAPSPTGYLHIGGVRTALYGWLWARRNAGRFVLRIEDTDAERSTAESVEVVLESMRWLGLDWDEGPGVSGPNEPYFQSERLPIYAEYAERLIASGHAYRCYATKEEIQAARDAFTAAGGKAGFVFKSPWRDREAPPPDESAPHVVRFKSPETGSTAWDDLVKGRIEVPNATLQDFVLVRTDKMPLYNFSCVVDDIEMGMTLVARGDDHVINTPPQILLYRALGKDVPTFAHVPMVLAPNGQKLSKRFAAVAVLEYRDMGYLPDAVLNYLVRLGWSHGDQEIFTREELVEKFDWDHVGAQAGRYDAKKFAHVQAEHLRMAPDDVLCEGVVSFLEKLGLDVDADDPRLRAALPYAKPRAVTFVDLADAVSYFVRDGVVFEAGVREKVLTPSSAADLRALAETVREVTPFDDAALSTAVSAWLEATGRTMKQVAQPARVALTGRTRSAGLFEVMQVLGRETTLARLEAGAQLAEGSAGSV
jgi:glutamyl-tRNA synthetase